MGFGECVRDELKIEANADLERAGAGLGEEPVIESTTAAEASAACVEGEAGTDEGVDFLEGDFRGFVVRFEDAERSGAVVVAGVESEVVAADFRIDPR